MQKLTWELRTTCPQSKSVTDPNITKNQTSGLSVVLFMSLPPWRGLLSAKTFMSLGGTSKVVSSIVSQEDILKIWWKLSAGCWPLTQRIGQRHLICWRFQCFGWGCKTGKWRKKYKKWKERRKNWNSVKRCCKKNWELLKKYGNWTKPNQLLNKQCQRSQKWGLAAVSKLSFEVMKWFLF